MIKQPHSFTDRELLDILTLVPIATAIYSTEQILIHSVNDAMLSFWGRGKEIIGLPLEIAVPELAGQGFIGLLRQVWNTGVTYEATDTAAELLINGTLQTFYYDFSYRALKRDNGEVYCILHTAADVTERVLRQQAVARAKVLSGALENEQALTEELTAANEELHATYEEMRVMQTHMMELNNELEQRVADRVQDLADSKRLLDEILHQMPAPIVVLEGNNQKIGMVNAAILSFWNKRREEVLGKTMLEVFPELINQPFPGLWNAVLKTGKSISNREQPVTFVKENTPRSYFVDYFYQPLKDSTGRTTAVLATVLDVTDKVESRKKIEDNHVKLLDLNDELSTINEEMAATNEELVTINEELAKTREDLLKTIAEVAKSEARFRFLVNQAPVAICVLDSDDLRIESANEMMLQILGKSADIIGEKYGDAVPELKNQAYLEILTEVFKTGKPHVGNEELTFIEENSEMRAGYYNYIFQPIQNEEHQTVTIMIVATDVTEHVASRKELRRTEEMLRLSIEAANVGNWFLNIATKDFYASAQLKELFGYQIDEPLTYDEAILHIPESHRSDVLKSMATTDGDNHYNIEFPILPKGITELRWVKALGKSELENGSINQFSGVIMDITEQKQDELRKNDFIGMVSHELKTPLTSLNGYTQILHHKAKKSGDQFAENALEKVVQQIKKMTSLINGFLNISRLESGKIQLQKELFSVNKLVNDLVEESRLLYTTHEIQITATEEVDIYADREKIGSVVSNLLSNAVKYSPQAKTVEITCGTKDGMLLISVKDYGMGIKETDIERLFDRFYRVEGADNQHISGFGIGLYLSAEIIDRHGGTISVVSKPGEGSTFNCTIPIGKN